jgi:hypothetical protein
LCASLSQELVRDGFGARDARERALAVVALLEGGYLIAIAQQSVQPARSALKAAALLCRVDSA